MKLGASLTAIDRDRERLRRALVSTPPFERAAVVVNLAPSPSPSRSRSRAGVYVSVPSRIDTPAAPRTSAVVVVRHQEVRRLAALVRPGQRMIAVAHPVTRLRTGILDCTVWFGALREARRVVHRRQRDRERLIARSCRRRRSPMPPLSCSVHGHRRRCRTRSPPACRSACRSARPPAAPRTARCCCCVTTKFERLAALIRRTSADRCRPARDRSAPRHPRAPSGPRPCVKLGASFTAVIVMVKVCVAAGVDAAVRRSAVVHQTAPSPSLSRSRSAPRCRSAVPVGADRRLRREQRVVVVRDDEASASECPRSPAPR